MTLARPVVVTLACLMLASVPEADQDPAPTFRATTDLVEVEVSVRANGGPVGGLTAADFQLIDNGVVQTIESLELTTLPVDVSLLIDTSGATTGSWTTPPPDSRVRAEIARDVGLVREMLRPGDRVRLVTIDTYIRQVVGFHPAADNPDIGPVDQDGLASLYDALAEALLRPIDPGRRHFVFARTRAIDTMSAVAAASVSDLAARSQAVLHIVLDDASLLAENLLQDCHCTQSGLCLPTRRFWLPIQRRPPLPRSASCENVHDPRNFDATRNVLPRSAAVVQMLEDAASTTGGAVHGAGLFANRSVVDTFRSIFDTYRRGYVLRYVPSGIAREGRHTIEVTVPSRPSAVVSARRGYWIDPPSPNVMPAVEGPAPSTPLAALARVFETGDGPAFVVAVDRSADVNALLRAARTSPAQLPASPRLDLVFGLELARAALRRDDARTLEEVGRLLAHYDALVRHPFGPDEFECAWHGAASAVLVNLFQPAFARPFVERALTRCSESSRLRLALAVVTDQQMPFGSVESAQWQSHGFAVLRAHRENVRRLYEEAARYPDAASEARIRGAWFLLRVGEADDALAWLDMTRVAMGDRYLGYLETLIRGHVYGALNRDDEAAEMFRRALAIWPRAQSARVALMTLLVQSGQITEAGDLAAQIQTAPEDVWDPWWQYWQGDYRVYPAILANLRERAR